MRFQLFFSIKANNCVSVSAIEAVLLLPMSVQIFHPGACPPAAEATVPNPGMDGVHVSLHGSLRGEPHVTLGTGELDHVVHTEFVNDLVILSNEGFAASRTWEFSRTRGDPTFVSVVVISGEPLPTIVAAGGTFRTLGKYGKDG